jgi:hypothetical protein
MLNPSKILLNPVNSILFAGLLMITTFTTCGILDADKSPSLNIETDKDIYDLNEHEYVAVKIENNSDQTIYYSTCLARELEIIKDGELFDTIPYGVCYCICSATLEPGEKVFPDVSKVNISILKDKSDTLPSSNTISYRVKYSFYEDKAWGENPLPNHELRSNKFKLILPH